MINESKSQIWKYQCGLALVIFSEMTLVYAKMGLLGKLNECSAAMSSYMYL